MSFPAPVSRAKTLLERYVGASQAIHDTSLHETLRRKEIGPIHHLALRGLQFDDGRHTLERFFSCALEAAGYERMRSGAMPSIRGEFVEWAPAGSVGSVGLPDDPYVFTSLCHVRELSQESQSILKKLRPLFCAREESKEVSADEVVRLPYLSFDDYATLKADSQYAAWFVTNTLAVGRGRDAVNHLAYVLNFGESLKTCDEMNDFLRRKGWQLNTYNGVDVQRDETPEDGYIFRQSSVVATPITVRFKDDNQDRPIPGLFHEFVEHPMSLPFRGFSNARALFTSTANIQHQSAT